jgi:hypothetical protein
MSFYRGWLSQSPGHKSGHGATWDQGLGWPEGSGAPAPGRANQKQPSQRSHILCPLAEWPETDPQSAPELGSPQALA